MAVGPVSLYRRTLAERQHLYDAAIATGQYTPFLYPWDTLPALYLFLAIIICPRLPPKWSVAVRYMSFLVVTFHFAYIISHRRTLGFAGGYIMGIASAWGVVMAGTLLVLNDPGKDFTRLETRPATEADHRSQADHSAVQNTSSSTGESHNIDLRRRKVPGVYSSTDIQQQSLPEVDKPATRPYRLVWQGFPRHSERSHVLDWAVDLITNFRGVNWNHRIPTAGEIDAPLPPHPTDGDSKAKDGGRATAVPWRTLRSFQRRTIQDFVFLYLFIDCLKTIMMTDPYFLGLEPLDSPAPWQCLALLNSHIPMATRCVRLLVSMTAVITALTFVYSLSPLIFGIVLPALFDVSRITKAPLLEPWMYPPQWHPLTRSVLNSSLAGFWGKFWHQMFRFGISEPSRVLIQRLRLDQRGTPARFIQLLVGFAVSGLIHATGSYTAFSIKPSRPLTGPLTFFLTQALGVLLQYSVVTMLHRHVPAIKSFPRVLGQIANLVFVLFYLYSTGPLLADDFARCGIWLFEPVPISLFRGLGFGPGGNDEGWWVWYQEGAQWTGWWKGDRWWTRGFAIY
ncbi:hypothetical protein ABEF95_011939 [Exophiala dermatitidis]